MFDTSIFKRGVRFSLTGLLVTGLHVLAAGWLIYTLEVPPPEANAGAFAAATIVAYTINAVWSFEQAVSLGTMARYLVVASLGLFTSWTVAAVAEAVGWHPLLGIACVAVAVPAISFMSHYFWTFSGQNSKR